MKLTKTFSVLKNLPLIDRYEQTQINEEHCLSSSPLPCVITPEDIFFLSILMVGGEVAKLR